jgi:hypothetical protein
MTPALQHRTGKVVERGTAWPLGATPTDYLANPRSVVMLIAR